MACLHVVHQGLSHVLGDKVHDKHSKQDSPEVFQSTEGLALVQVYLLPRKKALFISGSHSVSLGQSEVHFYRGLDFSCWSNQHLCEKDTYDNRSDRHL